MTTALRKRLAALEVAKPAQASSGLKEAIRRIHDALYASLRSDPGMQVPSPIYSHAYGTVGYVSSRTKVLELGQRLREGTETADDIAVLDALPADALAVARIDARGFVEMILSLEERF